MNQPVDWIPSESSRTDKGPVVKKAWGALGCGVGGGYFVGALTSWESVGGRILGVVIGAPLFLLGCAGLLIQIGRRVRVSIVPRVALLVAAVGAGYQLARALSYEVAGPPPQDLGKAFSSSYGVSGLVLLGSGILLALYFSFRRFEPVGPPSD